MIEIVVAILALVIFLTIGLLCLIMPDKVRQYYLKDYVRGLIIVRLDPSFWIRHFPNNLAFRISGVISVAAAILILYLLLRRFW